MNNVNRTYVYDMNTANELLKLGKQIIQLMYHNDGSGKVVYVFAGDCRKEKFNIIDKLYK